jgi:hypothetical protein
MFVGPKPAFGLFMDGWFEHIPAALGDFRRGCSRRKLKRLVIDDSIRAVRLGMALGRNDFSSGPKSEHACICVTHIFSLPKVSMTTPASLGSRVRSQVILNLPPLFQQLEHPNYRALLGNHTVTRTGAQTVENEAKERIFETLRNDGPLPIE